jgi:hypothetical protein
MHHRVNSYRDLKEFSEASREWSERRRSRATEDRQQNRRLDAALLVPAVVGLLLIVKFCSYSTPYVHWFYGVIAVALMLPYLTRRIS